MNRYCRTVLLVIILRYEILLHSSLIEDFTYRGAGRGISRNVHSDGYSFNDAHRRPSFFVWTIPDLDRRAILGQVPDNRGNVLIGRSMHRGLTVLVYGVNIAAELQRDFDRLEN